ARKGTTARRAGVRGGRCGPRRTGRRGRTGPATRRTRRASCTSMCPSAWVDALDLVTPQRVRGVAARPAHEQGHLARIGGLDGTAVLAVAGGGDLDALADVV